MHLYTILDILTTLTLLGLFVYGCHAASYQYIVGSLVAYFAYPLLYEPIYNLLAVLLYSESRYKEEHLRFHEDVRRVKVPIVYHPTYNITAGGIEKLHPFDSQKYQKVFEALLAGECLASAADAHEPRSLVSRATLLNFGVSKSYLLALCYSLRVTSAVEVPVCLLPACILRWRVQDPQLMATQGSIEAACLALDRGCAINLSGGNRKRFTYGRGGEESDPPVGKAPLNHEGQVIGDRSPMQEIR